MLTPTTHVLVLENQAGHPTPVCVAHAELLLTGDSIWQDTGLEGTGVCAACLLEGPPLDVARAALVQSLREYLDGLEGCYDLEHAARVLWDAGVRHANRAPLELLEEVLDSSQWSARPLAGPVHE